MDASVKTSTRPASATSVVAPRSAGASARGASSSSASGAASLGCPDPAAPPDPADPPDPAALPPAPPADVSPPAPPEPPDAAPPEPPDAAPGAAGSSDEALHASVSTDAHAVAQMKRSIWPYYLTKARKATAGFGLSN
jgi:hypothetical protein